MASQQDKESRTEEATEKRLADAREEGNTPSTPEASVFGTLLASAIAVMALLPSSAERMSYDLTLVLANAGSFSVRNPQDIGSLIGAVMHRVAIELSILIGTCVIVGAAIVASQGAPLVALRRVTPRSENVSPLRGLSRIFGRQAIAQLAKTLLKLSIVLGLGVWLVARELEHFETLLTLDVMALPAELVRSLGLALMILAAASAFIFVADSTVVRRMWRRSLRMTKEEVSREQREMEGEPFVKARRRALSRARTRQRSLANVPKATMVIVNPTHYAVALRYVPELDDAPRVMAKGQDLVALAIRRVAEERGIPLVEDKALARSLYASVEAEQQIPPEFYRAIAAIVATLDKRKGEGRQRTVRSE